MCCSYQVKVLNTSILWNQISVTLLLNDIKIHNYLGSPAVLYIPHFQEILNAKISLGMKKSKLVLKGLDI